jgi:glycerate kinase
MRILIAPDGFKGSLSALDAAEAMCRGVARARPGAETRLCALSDGGEGIARVLRDALGGTTHATNVTGPLGPPVRAEWTMLGDGRTALIESAAAIGLSLVPAELRAATATTTAGVGDLIAEALSAGAKKIVIGLGGSATTDGGAGMAERLGVAFHGVNGRITGGALESVRALDVHAVDPRLASVELVALTDVDNPLGGPHGAAQVYGPQKGASSDEIAELERALSHLSRLASDPGLSPGDGAAGGLGYGLRVFLGARLRSGIDFVLEQTGFDAKLEACDLVLTGEGRLDAQTARGKVVAGVARRCRARGVPVMALAGAIGAGAESLYDLGLTAYFSLCDGPMAEREAMTRASELLEAATSNAVRAWSHSG